MRCAVIALCLWAAAAQAETYAIVIGHNAALDDRPDLRFADDDAARFYELLAPVSAQAHLLTSLDADSQRLFPDLLKVAKPASLSQLDRALASIRVKLAEDAAAGRDSTLYFVYAGHGDIDQGEGYISFADGKLTRSGLRERVLSGQRADRIHVIVDACKSYYLVAGRGPGGRREAHPEPYVTPVVTEGVGYIMSTSNDAASHEWAAVRGGVFSHEVRSALLGAADLDGDGGVDYRELETFVAVAKDALAHSKYRPNVYIHPPSNDRAAHVLRARSGASLTLSAGAAGRLSVTDPRGLAYADTHKGTGAPLRLALLHPGRYGVTWSGQHYALETTAEATEADLQPTAPVAPRSDGDHAFRQLFEKPLEPGVLLGFRLAADRPLAAPREVEKTPAWLAPSLAIVGVAAAGAGVGLHLAALDESDAAGQAAQVDIREHEARATGFAVGAASAYVVATGALVAAAWLYFSE